jgi:hypothetical protein
MNVLLACEFSGVVREAFRARGHNAWSCDLLPTEVPGSHHKGNVLDFIRCTPYLFDPLVTWDLLVAHPPCTYLTNSGARWLYKGGRGSVRDPDRWEAMERAADFYNALWHAQIPRKCIENPVMHGHGARLTGHCAPDIQIIQPWQFGHGEIKATGLRLYNLPPLVPTKIVSGRTPRVHHASPGPDRWKERSRTLQGIADAMADQWGQLA